MDAESFAYFSSLNANLDRSIEYYPGDKPGEVIMKLLTPEEIAAKAGA